MQKNYQNFETADIERNLFLKAQLSNHTAEYSGKPSIDRPWLKYYEEHEIKSRIPQRSLYEDLLENNKNNISGVAINYFGNQITFGELFDEIDRTASAFASIGVVKGDIVSICLPFFPETIYTIYALNKLGAVVHVVDPRINAKLIQEFFVQTGSKYAVIISKIEDKIASIIDGTDMKKVISVDATNSMQNPVLKTLGKLKRSKFMRWNTFIKLSGKDIEIAPREISDLSFIEYTSGTSGNPKGVMLSDFVFNAMSYFQKQILEMDRLSKFLLIMPPFIAFGLVVGMHVMLCHSQQLLMIPNFTLDKAPQMLGQLIDKYQPNYIMGIPNFLLILMRSYDKDLSFLKGIIVGGDHLEPEIEKNAIAYFERHHANISVLKGWGMSELASCGSFSKTNVTNKIGSVGIPLSKNIIKLLPPKGLGEYYDIDSEELGYGEEGILFISSPSMMLGYHKNDAATAEVIYTDKEGRPWVNTGDIFMIDEDGYMFYKGREKNVITGPDGHNIPTDQINSIVSSFNEVEMSVVVGIRSKKYSQGFYGTVCIALKDKNLSESEIHKLLKRIEEACNYKLQPRDRAKYYFVVDEIPYTPNSKVDYKALQQRAQSKIYALSDDEESKKTFYLIEGE